MKELNLILKYEVIFPTFCGSSFLPKAQLVGYLDIYFNTCILSSSKEKHNIKLEILLPTLIILIVKAIIIWS